MSIRSLRMEANQLRILHLYKNYAPIIGGIENHIKMLAEGEAARGLQTTVLVVNESSANRARDDQWGRRDSGRACRQFRFDAI